MVDQKCPVKARTDVIYRNATFQIPISTDVTKIMIECTGNKYYPMWCAQIPVALN